MQERQKLKNMENKFKSKSIWTCGIKLWSLIIIKLEANKQYYYRIMHGNDQDKV